MNDYVDYYFYFLLWLWSALELLDRALCKLSFIIIITITITIIIITITIIIIITITIIIIIIINSPVSVLTNLRQDHLQHSEMFSWNKIIHTYIHT